MMAGDGEAGREARRDAPPLPAVAAIAFPATSPRQQRGGPCSIGREKRQREKAGRRGREVERRRVGR